MSNDQLLMALAQDSNEACYESPDVFYVNAISQDDGHDNEDFIKTLQPHPTELFGAALDSSYPEMDRYPGSTRV